MEKPTDKLSSSDVETSVIKFAVQRMTDGIITN